MPVLAFLFAAMPALAQPHGPHRLANCKEATNGCEVCRFDASGEPRCSFPGIACQPAAWRCIKPAERATDSQPATRPEPR